METNKISIFYALFQRRLFFLILSIPTKPLINKIDNELILYLIVLFPDFLLRKIAFLTSLFEIVFLIDAAYQMQVGVIVDRVLVFYIEIEILGYIT